MKITRTQIEALRQEAREHQDTAQSHICSVALGEQEPITTELAWEDRYGGGGHSREEKAAIMRVESRGQAWAECERVIDHARAQD